MVEEKKGLGESTPDLDRFYKVLSGYVEFCMQKPKSKMPDKKKEGSEKKEYITKENELKTTEKEHEKQGKIFKRECDALYDEISKNGIPYLTVYVETLKKLYDDKPKWKRDINDLLVCWKSRKLFVDARSSIVDLYPVLLKVNSTFMVDDYSELSLSPKAAIYGSEVEKTQTGSTKKPPMKNEEYKAMLELFRQEKDYKRLGEWLMAIFAFSPDQVVDMFQKDYTPEKKALREWAYQQLNTDENYRRAVIDLLLKDQQLIKLMDVYASRPGMENRLDAQEAEIKQLHEINQRESEQHDDQRLKQLAIIQQKEAENAALRDKLRDFERCSEQLTDYIEKYQAQIGINERVTLENNRRIQAMETIVANMEKEVCGAKEQLKKLQSAYTALQSDYSLKNNELQRLKETASKKEEASRGEVLRELVSGIHEEVFYLTMFYLELKQSGKLEPDSIDLYAYTLNKIDAALARLGIKKLGVIDQTVAYDSSIHTSSDAKLSNGDSCIVQGYGWKIGDLRKYVDVSS